MTIQSENGALEVVALGAAACELDHILLLGKTADVDVLGGVWLKANGRQTGVSFAPTTIPYGDGATAGVSLATVFDAERPSDATGVKIVVTGNLWLCLGAGDDVCEADFRAHPTQYLPVVALGPDMANSFGRVG